MTLPKPYRSPCTNDVQDLGIDALGVVLQTGAIAIFDRRAFHALESRRQIGRMFWNCGAGGIGYVRMQGPTNLVTVARLLTQARPDEDVTYRNGNRLDLRLANLDRRPRWGKCKPPQATARDLFPTDPEAQAAWLQLTDRRRVAREDAHQLGGAMPRPVRHVALSNRPKTSEMSADA